MKTIQEAATSFYTEANEARVITWTGDTWDWKRVVRSAHHWMMGYYAAMTEVYGAAEFNKAITDVRKYYVEVGGKNGRRRAPRS